MLMNLFMFSQFTLAFLQTALFGLDLLFNNQKKKKSPSLLRNLSYV